MEIESGGPARSRSFTMTSEEVKEKSSSGANIRWYLYVVVATYDEAQRAIDPTSTNGFVAFTQCQYGWCGQVNTVGWTDKNLFITNKCKNIERAVMLIDLLDSDECNRMLYSGAKGVNWDYNEDGVPVINESTLDARSQGGDAWALTGIQNGIWSNLIGYDGSAKSEDGYAFNLFNTADILKKTLNPVEKDFANYYQVDIPSQVLTNRIDEGICYNQSNAYYGVSTFMDMFQRILQESMQNATKSYLIPFPIDYGGFARDLTPHATRSSPI